jgi:hypothetical protein
LNRSLIDWPFSLKSARAFSEQDMQLDLPGRILIASAWTWYK